MLRRPLLAHCTADHPPRGIALVIVLAFLALLTVLIVAFFTSVQVEQQGAKTYANSVTVKQLAETTSNVVMGQISDATRSYLVPGDTTSTRLTWASQPGLIHTYGDDGSPGRSFKLYSALNMVESPGTDFLPLQQLGSEVPDTWPSAPALFADLNSPVLVPNDSGKIKGADGKTYTANYPILDPLGQYDSGSQTGIEGFSIQSAPGFGAKTWTPDESYNPTVSSDATKTSNPAPMPVRWLYVLRNGALTAPDATGTTTATWANAPDNLKPTVNNPIVGRVAFWTDDETCKLNINTASEGVYWDRAFARSTSAGSPFAEDQLNTRIPVRGEYYRYPGHPATVCLSPVLGGLIPQMKVPAGDMISTSDFNSFYKPYYDLAPRITEGGTLGGTVDTYKATSGAYTSDVNRLYSSVDELLFASPDSPGYKGGPTSPDAQSQPHPFCAGASQVLPHHL